MADASVESRPAGNKYLALVSPYQACVSSAQRLIGYSQNQFLEGNVDLLDSLNSAIETEAVCSLVLSLANLKSRFAPAVTRRSIQVIEAAIAATQAQATRHAECLRFHDACMTARAAARAWS